MNPKKQISDDDSFFGTRVKQYASARMAVGIKIWHTFQILPIIRNALLKIQNVQGVCVHKKIT